MQYVMIGTQPPRRGNRDAADAPQGVFRCAGDDEWIAYADLHHPEVAVRRHIGPAWRFSDSDVRVRRPAPLLYADTDSVLHELLGYDEEQIRRLRAAGAIA